jgi:predicted permease
MQVILDAVVPVLIVALIGYGLARMGRPFDPKTITFLVGTIGTPVLVFTNLAKSQIGAEALAAMMGATMLAALSFLIVGAAVLKASGLSLRAFLPSLAFPNNGNLGLPLALYAFGQEGLNFAIAFFAIISVGNHTVGQTIAAGHGRWRAVLSSPIIYAALAGLLWAIVRWPLPVWADNTLTLLSGLTIPLLLIMLGTSLAKIPVTTFPRAALLSVVRLAMGTLVGFALAHLFGMEGAARGAFVLQCAMPVAVYNYVYSQMYNTAPEEVASLVVISTVMSVVTVPLLLLILTG